MYYKLLSLLPNIIYRNKVSDILLLLILIYDKITINKIIVIINEIVEYLKLFNKIVKNKIFFLKNDLVTILCFAEINYHF